MRVYFDIDQNFIFDLKQNIELIKMIFAKARNGKIPVLK